MEDQIVVESGKKWEFDGDVAAVFDDMLERSIPSYKEMRTAVFETASRYIRPSTNVIDLGASRGESVAGLVGTFGARNQFILCEISDPMLEAASERFADAIDNGHVELRKLDLRTSFPPESASVILSVLTLQFVPIEYRMRIVEDVYKHLEPGGAFILVEKLLGSTAELDATMVDIYYGLKRSRGYTQIQIDRKRLSLEGVLVPVTDEWNREILEKAGFSAVDCIWRWMNFAAYVAVKER